MAFQVAFSSRYARNVERVSQLGHDPAEEHGLVGRRHHVNDALVVLVEDDRPDDAWDLIQALQGGAHGTLSPIACASFFMTVSGLFVGPPCTTTISSPWWA